MPNRKIKSKRHKIHFVFPFAWNYVCGLDGARVDWDASATFSRAGDVLCTFRRKIWNSRSASSAKGFPLGTGGICAVGAVRNARDYCLAKPISPCIDFCSLLLYLLNIFGNGIKK